MDWEWSGNGLGMVWEWSGNGLGMEWEWSENGMGMVWERNGNGLGMTSSMVVCMRYNAAKVSPYRSILIEVVPILLKVLDNSVA